MTFPVTGMKGFDVDEVVFTNKGFEYDRDWCVLNTETMN